MNTAFTLKVCVATRAVADRVARSEASLGGARIEGEGAVATAAAAAAAAASRTRT